MGVSTQSTWGAFFFFQLHSQRYRTKFLWTLYSDIILSQILYNQNEDCISCAFVRHLPSQTTKPGIFLKKHKKLLAMNSKKKLWTILQESMKHFMENKLVIKIKMDGQNMIMNLV